MDNEWKQFDTYGRICIWAGIAVAGVFGICCLYNFESGSLYDVGEKVGAFIAGTSGVLWALAGVFFFISALRLQHKALLVQQNDLQLQRDDIKLQLEVMKGQQKETEAQRKIMEEQQKNIEAQRKTLELQQFEVTFFNLLEEITKVQRSFKIEEVDPFKNCVRQMLLDSESGEYGFTNEDLEILIQNHLEHEMPSVLDKVLDDSSNVPELNIIYSLFHDIIQYVGKHTSSGTERSFYFRLLTNAIWPKNYTFLVYMTKACREEYTFKHWGYAISCRAFYNISHGDELFSGVLKGCY